jgi:MFS transporter, ACS family, glucarate transporter
MTVTLAFLTYMDRVCISVTAPAILRELRLSNIEMGFVFSAFTAAYALFEIPTGWWADRIGSRHVLTRIVTWWSIFTGLTGVAWNFPSLLALRALFGAGEAGAWPTVARALSRWFPEQERGTAQGIFFMGAHLGGGLTPILVAAIAARIGWRGTFPLLSFFGFIWAVSWFRWYRDEPRDHASITPEELGWIEGGRRSTPEKSGGDNIFRAALRTPGIWFLCLMYFTQTYGFNLYVTWMPTYLQHEKHLHGNVLAILAGLPLLLSVPADLFGGILTDRLSQKLGLRLGRCRSLSFRWSIESRSGFRSADRAGRCLIKFSARSKLGYLCRYCRQPRGYSQRCDEYFRTGRGRTEPDCVRISHSNKCVLGSTPLRDRGLISWGRSVLVFCASRTNSGNERIVPSHDLRDHGRSWSPKRF